MRKMWRLAVFVMVVVFWISWRMILQSLDAATPPPQSAVLLLQAPAPLHNNNNNSGVSPSQPSALGNSSSSSSRATMADAVDAWPPAELLPPNGNTNTTWVVMIVTCLYLDMADNLIQSMGLENNANNKNIKILMVPLDEASYRVATNQWHQHDQQQQHVIILPVPPFVQSLPNWQKRTAQFQSKSFHQLTSSRPAILQAILSASSLTNTSILYTDTDMVWQRQPQNVLERLQHYAQTTRANVVAVLDEKGLAGARVCSGFLYLTANKSPGTYHFLQVWMEYIARNKFANDQYALYAAVRNQRKQGNWVVRSSSSSLTTKSQQQTLNKNNKTILCLLAYNNSEFPSGKAYFQEFSQHQQSQALVVHNNWIMKHGSKIKRFQRFGLWHPSPSFPKNLTAACRATSAR